MTSYPIRISFHKHFCDSPKLLHLKCERSTCTIIVCFEQTVRTCCETTRQWDRFQCSSCDKQRTLCIFIHNLFADNESVGSGYYLICSLSRLLCCVGSDCNLATALFHKKNGHFVLFVIQPGGYMTVSNFEGKVERGRRLEFF